MIFLSLLGVTAVGILTLGRSETRIARDQDRQYQARLSALSAEELALLRLTRNPSCTGFSGTALPGDMGTVDVSITRTDDFTASLDCSGSCGATQARFQRSARLYPRHYLFALAVSDQLEMKQNARILGDAYVGGIIKGTSTAMVTGDLYLYGSRGLTYQMGGGLAQIDGLDVPSILGDVLIKQDLLPHVSWSLSALKALAIGSGQYVSSNQTISSRDLSGVVYVARNLRLALSDVTLTGVLVMEPPDDFSSICAMDGSDWTNLTGYSGEISIVSGHYFKVVSDDSVASDLAILAPVSRLKVESSACLDVVGSSILGAVEFTAGGSGVLTGTTLVHGDALLDGDYVFQSPSPERDSLPDCVNFTDFEMSLSEYTEP